MLGTPDRGCTIAGDYSIPPAQHDGHRDPRPSAYRSKSEFTPTHRFLWSTTIINHHVGDGPLIINKYRNHTSNSYREGTIKGAIYPIYCFGISSKGTRRLPLTQYPICNCPYHITNQNIWDKESKHDNQLSINWYFIIRVNWHLPFSHYEY